MMDPSTVPIEIPRDVLDLILRIFSTCNDEVSSTLSRIPTIHEDALDQLFISHLNRIAPTSAPHSGWIVDVQTHFLGGGHHMGTWEIADIGVLVVLRRHGAETWSKVAILQSKRLFPNGAQFDAGSERAMFRWGFGRLHESYTPLRQARTFEFTPQCRYESLDLSAPQAERIALYQSEMTIPVHYLLYNPLLIPSSQSLPAAPTESAQDPNVVGCRIVQAAQLLELSAHAVRVPRYEDVASIVAPHGFAPFSAGWRLEDFVVTLLLGCHEGKVLNRTLDDTMELLFYRRSYPIAAAFVVNLEVVD